MKHSGIASGKISFIFGTTGMRPKVETLGYLEARLHLQTNQLGGLLRVIVFGATGMVGQGVLRESVLDPEVETVLAVVRRTGSLGPELTGGKVRELVAGNFYDFAGIENEFAGYDACFFCLGVSSVGMKEAEYRRVTYDLATAAARAVLRANEASGSASQQASESARQRAGGMTFIYVSGAGTDAKGGQMWARVKGETEHALLQMGFKAAYMFRPGLIVPLHGIRSKTAVYRVTYTLLTPLLPILLRVFPKHVTTTEQVGRAMLRVAKQGYPKAVLEAADIASA
jgi:uncharacterized protein YbjT (DUF2867 family)